MDLTEKRLRREDKYKGILMDVHVDTVELPNGETSLREVADHTDGVAVLPLDERNNVLAVTQYRYVFGRTTLEIPAGKLDPGEEPAAGALRELAEETARCRRCLCPWAVCCPPPAASGRRCTSFWPGACGWRPSIWTRTSF